MKNEEMKNEIEYEVQSYSDRIDDWFTLDGGIRSKKEAKSFVSDCKRYDKKEGLKIKYRIIKLTIKEEVVK